jgi:hypothetical protein
MPKMVKPNWQTERAGILLRLCKLLERGSEKGKPVHKLAALYSRRWNSRPYKSDATKRMHLSESALRRIFYRWKTNRGVEAFALHYATTNKRLVPSVLILEILRRSQSVFAPSLQAVINEVEGDWRRGKRIPGLKTGSRKARLPFRFSLQRHCRGIQFKKRRAIVQRMAELDAELRAVNFSIAQRAKQFSGGTK